MPVQDSTTVGGIGIGGNRAQGSSELRDATRQFEAILIRQMLRFADRSNLGGTLLDGGSAGRMYRELFYEQVAELAARRGGFGIAGLMESSLGGEDLHRSDAASGGSQ